MVVIAGTVVAACGRGDPSTVEPVGQPAATTTITSAPAARSYSSELTTSDGYRYKITVAVGGRSATGAAEECPPAAAPGRIVLPVTVTVANLATDRPAPFPPLRVEMTAAPGTKPAQVLVRDPSGTCTFAPRVPSLGPGASVVFKGTTPAIDEAAAAGSAGRLEVNVSESAFSVAAPVP